MLELARVGSARSEDGASVAFYSIYIHIRLAMNTYDNEQRLGSLYGRV
jgi:hypothetical protein